ncbi:MAG TPA: Flp pilus assembly protein CpaB [Burkholderiaceae bacterium]|nr:Flp pilus assembly protein CpaB [Burkholderiaceae bacterium]
MTLIARLARHRTLLVFAAAIVFGAFAAYGARSYIMQRLAIERAQLAPRHDLVEIVVAKRDLRRGEIVSADTMALRSLPREFAPGGAVTAGGFDAHVGQRLVVAMRGGEPLLPASLQRIDPSAFSSRLRPGVRALTVAVDEVNSLSGMLQPGDRIDLLLSVRPPPHAGLAQPEITRPLMQDLLVLATGRQSRPAGEDSLSAVRSFGTITVEVDPERAQRLVVAQRSGKLTAVLRNPHDRQPIGDRRLDIHSLLDLPAPPQLRGGPEIIVGGRGPLPAPAPSLPEVEAAAAPRAAVAAGSAVVSVPRAPAPGEVHR